MPSQTPMQYEIVQKIVIRDDEVWLLAAYNDIRPLRYTYREEPVLTAVFQQDGLHGLLALVAQDIYRGRIHLRAGSRITRALRSAIHELTLEQFQSMEEERAVSQLVAITEQLLQDLRREGITYTGNYKKSPEVATDSRKQQEDKNIVTVRLFGKVELENAEGHFEENRGRQPLSCLLLKYLLMHPERKTLSEEMFSHVWPMDCGSTAYSTAIVRLRRAREMLEPLDLSGVNGLIQFRDDHLYLNPDCTLQYDVQEFLSLHERSKECPVDDPEGLALAVAALNLFRAPLLEFTDPAEAPWVVEHREFYRKELKALAYDALERMKALYDYRELPILCRRAAAMLPEEETLHREMIGALMEQELELDLINHVTQLNRSGTASWLE